MTFRWLKWKIIIQSGRNNTEYYYYCILQYETKQNVKNLYIIALKSNRTNLIKPTNLFSLNYIPKLNKNRTHYFYWTWSNTPNICCLYISIRPLYHGEIECHQLVFIMFLWLKNKCCSLWELLLVILYGSGKVFCFFILFINDIFVD